MVVQVAGDWTLRDVLQLQRRAFGHDIKVPEILIIQSLGPVISGCT